MRDPFGVRPLVLGRLDGAMILASETVAFDIIGAEFVRDIEPGEMVIVSGSGGGEHQAIPPHIPALLHLRIHLLRTADSVSGRDRRYEARHRTEPNSP